MNFLVSEEEVRRFFFAAMRAGWAGEAEGEEFPGLPGSTGIVFEQDDLKLLDIWMAASGEETFAGTVTIWVSGVPVWTAQYGGCFEEGVVPFLREALAAAYKQNLFIGGRGPKRHQSGSLVYENKPETGSSFRSFRGSELIGDLLEPRQFGYAHYMGMALIPLG